MATIAILDATGAVRKYLTSRGKSEHTVKAYTTDVRMFFGEMSLDSVNLDDLEEYAATWLTKYRRTIAAKTTSRRLTSMRTLGVCYGLAILREYSAPTPARGVPHPLPDGKKDLQRMLDAASNEDQRVLIALMGLCGLRVTEARSVGPKDFDVHAKTLRIRGKGDKERIVPLSKAAWSILCAAVTKAWLEKKSTIVSYSDRSARECITRVAARAGVRRPVASHDLRATFATEAHNNTLNVRAVQELLGHASVEQTVLYTGVLDEQMRSAANFLEEDDEEDGEP